ncbi:DUF5133 domain-containing protein [Streptomyces sp. CBMA291]|nr:MULTISPECIES: DUF5133 domain-containing protein [unclassified Streptomyces]MBD0708809.1 DUF5133 domain-containing protein [Streptomyces sp. CBMA291]MBD0714747.1 DUF5133 domain-containing protein [Streptomyces sp. CBMA370]
MLLPDRKTVDRLLRHYRAQERTVRARPCDLSARRRFEDTTYTLCVLMGERTAPAAVFAAERHLAGMSLVPPLDAGTLAAPLEGLPVAPPLEDVPLAPPLEGVP